MSQTNAPDLWRDVLPFPTADGHKYDRGHAVILGAVELTGATRLAAGAATRVGAGLVTVLAEKRADLYRSILPPDIMVLEGEISDVKKASASLAGPGGTTREQRNMLHEARGLIRVLDADAIPGESERHVLDAHAILTPHDGEFAKAFPDIAEDDRQARAARAAEGCGAIVVLKGSETMLAHPDGRIVVNRHASRWLAKAGTGDVLAGMICGLTAQGMAPFDAACAAVWMHGEAGRRIGPGLIAGDIEAVLPAILTDLYAGSGAPAEA